MAIRENDAKKRGRPQKVAANRSPSGADEKTGTPDARKASAKNGPTSDALVGFAKLAGAQWSTSLLRPGVRCLPSGDTSSRGTKPSETSPNRKWKAAPDAGVFPPARWASTR